VIILDLHLTGVQWSNVLLDGMIGERVLLAAAWQHLASRSAATWRCYALAASEPFGRCPPQRRSGCSWSRARPPLVAVQPAVVGISLVTVARAVGRHR